MSQRTFINAGKREFAVVNVAKRDPLRCGTLFFTGSMWANRPVFHLRSYADGFAKALRAKGHKGISVRTRDEFSPDVLFMMETEAHWFPSQR